MIITLGTLNPNHSIFSKSYKPEVVNRAMQSDIQISNEDGFFTGLPKLTKLSDLKVKAGACFTKEEKLQIRMEKEKEKMRRCKQNLDNIPEEMKEVN
jgi:tRNA(Phe) wybutosine-synthesizing methylase Tyw3